MDHDYQRRLAETVTWCAGRARVDDAGRSTRTPSLLPQVLRNSLDSSLFQALGATNAARDAVSFICKQRRAILASSEIPVADVGPDLAGGRILCTDLNSDLCGAATAPSRSFIDDEDIPGMGHLVCVRRWRHPLLGPTWHRAPCAGGYRRYSRGGPLVVGYPPRSSEVSVDAAALVRAVG